jgi:LCP family protein required for cell wall assembly
MRGRKMEDYILSSYSIQQDNHGKRIIKTILFWIGFLICIAAYFFIPGRTNILILGTDYLPSRDPISRTDSIILATIDPWKSYAGMLSIPRDLWVLIPGVGENRINTAFFFAEAQNPGSGPVASTNAIQENFGITINKYLVVEMEQFVSLIDKLGGVEINLAVPMGGLPAGISHLDGLQALAFARERYSSDDFSRMTQGQIIMGAFISKLFRAENIFKTPKVILELMRSIETNIPLWLIPRLGFTIIRTGSLGIDYQIITREMASPYTMPDGAQVLIPDWDKINPVLMKMFNQ